MSWLKTEHRTLAASFVSPPAEAPDDGALVRAAREDPRAFARLYDRYATPIYRYCYARLRNPTAAQDAMSDVFFKALERLPQFRDGLFAAWLFRIAHNVVVDAVRRSHPTTSLEEVEFMLDSGDSPAESAIARSEREALFEAIETLPEEQRAVLELQLTGMKGQEIARALGRTHASVKMLRWRGVAAIKVFLSERGLLNEGERS